MLTAVLLLAAAGAAFALTRPERVRVPSVIEQPLSSARALLEKRGFEVVPRPTPACAELNTVTEQNPAAGTQADEGSEVTLEYSTGFTVTVPQTRDLTLAQATERLENENLLVNPARRRPSKIVRRDRVIRTDPAAGENVDCQSEVTPYVSIGPNLVTLPDVLGEQAETAEAELERLGFVVDLDPRDSDEPEGTVIEQDPGPGSELPRGERITLVFSTGAGSVVVPDVVGQPEETAIDALTGRGALNIEVIEQETDEESEDGRVLDQAPDAGTRIRAGDRVTIYVGEFVAPPEDSIEPQPAPGDGAEPPR